MGDDPRFKTSELSDVDKEDIFSDFVTELAKKEKEEVTEHDRLGWLFFFG